MLSRKSSRQIFLPHPFASRDQYIAYSSRYLALIARIPEFALVYFPVQDREWHILDLDFRELAESSENWVQVGGGEPLPRHCGLLGYVLAILHVLAAKLEL